MDSLQLTTSWNKLSASNLRNGVTATLSGIYIQGARMATGIGVEECKVDTPSWTPIPPCFLSWIPVDNVVSLSMLQFIELSQSSTNVFCNISQDSRSNGLHTVKVPLYVDEERQRLITVLDIPFASGAIDDWYRAGIALSLKD